MTKLEMCITSVNLTKFHVKTNKDSKETFISVTSNVQ